MHTHAHDGSLPSQVALLHNLRLIKKIEKISLIWSRPCDARQLGAKAASPPCARSILRAIICVLPDKLRQYRPPFPPRPCVDLLWWCAAACTAAARPMYICTYMYKYTHVQPIPLGVPFSKAQSSNVSFATFQWKETLELWALKQHSKTSPQVRLDVLKFN